jgi:hypothetical protein
MAAPDRTLASEEELQQGEDLGFGGWRDWLLVLMVLAITVIGAAAFVGYALSMRKLHTTLPGAVGALAVAGACSVLLWRRWALAPEAKRARARSPRRWLVVVGASVTPMVVAATMNGTLAAVAAGVLVVCVVAASPWSPGDPEP